MLFIKGEEDCLLGHPVIKLDQAAKVGFLSSIITDVFSFKMESEEGNSSCSLALVRKSGNHIAISISLLGGLVHTDSAYLRWIN